MAIIPYLFKVSDIPGTHCDPLSSTLDKHDRFVEFRTLKSMPGQVISFSLGLCDAFGNSIPSILGGTISYRWFDMSNNVVLTFQNGTSFSESVVPNIPFNSRISFSATFIGYGGENSLPSFHAYWNTTVCSPYFGFIESEGCIVCSAGFYSIQSSHAPCESCSELGNGGSCLSMAYESSSKDFVKDISLSAGKIVTVVTVGNNNWPSLRMNLETSSSQVVPIQCPFNFCDRPSDSSPIVVTGITVDEMFIVVSTKNLLCNPYLNRDPSSILCGKCQSGYSEWNNHCYKCYDGPDPIYILVFISQMIGWSMVQFIVAQQSDQGSITSVLVLLVQSLSWYLYPQSALEGVQAIIHYQIHISGANSCYMDVEPTTELFFRVLVPLLYFFVLWCLFFIHRIIASSCCHGSKQNLKDDWTVDRTEATKCELLWSSFSRVFVKHSTTDAYLRATALLILGTFSPILKAIFSVFSCQPVDVRILLKRFHGSMLGW